VQGVECRVPGIWLRTPAGRPSPPLAAVSTPHLRAFGVSGLEHKDEGFRVQGL
jgi:hypothetical protein